MKFITPLLFSVSLAACSPYSPASDASAQEAESGASGAGARARLSREEIAHLLCRYTRGGFPNWGLYGAYADYLTPDQRRGVVYMDRQLADQVAPAYRARYRAVEKFVARHTMCQLRRDPDHAPQENGGGEWLYVFRQRAPRVPPVADVDLSLPEPEKERAWFDALERAWDGAETARDAYIVLSPDDVSGYVLKTDLLKTYVYPLEWRRLNESFESLDFEGTQALLDASCEWRSPNCREFGAYFKGSLDGVLASRGRFAADVAMEKGAQKAVSHGAGQCFSTVRVGFDNRGGAVYRNIVLRAEFAPFRAAPQYCHVETPDGLPFVLDAGAQAVGICRLGCDAPAVTSFSLWIADPE